MKRACKYGNSHSFTFDLTCVTLLLHAGKGA